jgi:phage portal protein BeeE
MNKREIALDYNVRPATLSTPTRTVTVSVSEARKALYQENILPTMDRRRDNLNNALTPRFGDGLYLDYDRDQIEALHDDAEQAVREHPISLTG